MLTVVAYKERTERVVITEQPKELPYYYKESYISDDSLVEVYHKVYQNLDDINATDFSITKFQTDYTYFQVDKNPVNGNILSIKRSGDIKIEDLSKEKFTAIYESMLNFIKSI